MVKEAFFEHLLVQTCAVETSRETQFDVTDQRLFARCRHNAIGIITLVEHETLEDRPTVSFTACPWIVMPCSPA